MFPITSNIMHLLHQLCIVYAGNLIFTLHCDSDVAVPSLLLAKPLPLLESFLFIWGLLTHPSTLLLALELIF